MSPLDIILSTDGERLELLAKEKELKENDGTVSELNEIYQRLEAIDAYNQEHVAKTLLLGLGFSEEMIH